MAKQSSNKGLVELGIGVVSIIAADAILNTVKKLQKEGKLNKKEADKMIKDVTQKYKVASGKAASELQTQVNNLLKVSADASPFASKSDIKQLNAKIARLNAQLAKKPRKARK